MDHTASAPASDCKGGEMQATATNVHFHGLNVPPKCHQDDVLNTLIQSGDMPFEYHIQIPENDPPGLYWYHPHPHGFTTVQVAGGASGALIIEGMEKIRPEVAGLPERVLVIRQQSRNPGTWAPGPYELTVNFQPVVPGVFPLPVIQLRPNQKEFWRVLNAGPGLFLTLQLQYAETPQPLEVIALDGIPLSKPMTVTTLEIPPAGRAEFVIPGPPPETFGSLVSKGFDAGPLGDPIPAQPITNLETRDDAVEPARMPVAGPPAGAQRFAGLRAAAVTGERKLYFSETVSSTNNIRFFITVRGQEPKEFSADDPPAIVTHVGAVEDWTIENQATEAHVFHIHQLHFLVLEIDGKPVKNSSMQDTITIPYWTGTGRYHSVKLRMDFRDPGTAGTFVYHCHILDHEDAGMMAKIQVKP
jgi:FtsP/CotA-like multicopper oxidase with cupredoxin domain